MHNPLSAFPARRAALQLLLLCLAALIVFPAAVRADEPRLHLEVRVDRSDPQIAQSIEPQLIAAGFEIELGVPELGRWQGWLPAAQLEQLRALDGVVSVRAPQYAHFAAGATLTEGDEALNAAAARDRFNVDGSGVRVAVLSNGIRGLDKAQSAGEAPKLADARAFRAGVDDLGMWGEEGTAMIEIVHDLAPGAAISFGVVTSDLEHIAAVNYFAQRVDIIVDNTSFAFPADQRSDVSVNTTNALRNPDWPLRVHVTAAGNWAESHWRGSWQVGVEGRQIGLPTPGATHQFSGVGGAETFYGGGNRIRVGEQDEIRLILFWNDPWGRSSNDYNLYLISSEGAVLASSEITQGVGEGSGDPREVLEYTHDAPEADLFVVTQNPHNEAAPVEFDLFLYRLDGGPPQLSERTAARSLLAQSDAADALAVGAINVGRRAVAAYSSRGPTLNGVLKPDLTAVDLVTVSEHTGFGPRFLGSSAAAPHVAGVAALLLEAQPALLAADGGSALLERRLIRAFLTETAQDLSPAGPDPAAGAGLIDADAALEAATSQIVVVTTAADQGPGTLREAIASGAPIILLSHSPAEHTISLETELPAADGQVIDGAGWTLDAAAVSIGLQLGDRAELWGLTVTGARQVGVQIAGDESRLNGVTASGNRIGIRVTGAAALIEAATVENGQSHGIEIRDGGAATITASTIASNAGTGVRIYPAASDVLIGPTLDPPPLTLASGLATPIDPFASASPQPRSGLSQTINGSVRIAGLPAPAGTIVDLYLDRRLAASVAVDDRAHFHATVSGPGVELRFAVDGAPLDQRVPFAAGADTVMHLQAASPSTLVGADDDAAHASMANHVRDNLAAIDIIWRSDIQSGRRTVWGNRMSGNRTAISSSALPYPTINDLRWEPAGVILSGHAPAAAVVHLYAGPAGDRRYIGAAAVRDGQYRFRHVALRPEDTEFSVIAHTDDGRASPESAVERAPAPGSITSISPDSGYINGGEDVELCGARIATDLVAPQVWFGARSASVRFWSRDCVTVSTPPGLAGPTDITLRLRGERLIVAPLAFEYRPARIVSLKQGRNFVVWTGPDTRVTSAFAPLAGATFRVYGWDAAGGAWLSFATHLPSEDNTLRRIQHLQPLWIVLDSADIDWPQPVHTEP